MISVYQTKLVRTSRNFSKIGLSRSNTETAAGAGHNKSPNSLNHFEEGESRTSWDVTWGEEKVKLESPSNISTESSLEEPTIKEDWTGGDSIQQLDTIPSKSEEEKENEKVFRLKAREARQNELKAKRDEKRKLKSLGKIEASKSFTENELTTPPDPEIDFFKDMTPEYKSPVISKDLSYLGNETKSSISLGNNSNLSMDTEQAALALEEKAVAEGGWDLEDDFII